MAAIECPALNRFYLVDQVFKDDCLTMIVQVSHEYVPIAEYLFDTVVWSNMYCLKKLIVEVWSYTSAGSEPEYAMTLEFDKMVSRMIHDTNGQIKQFGRGRYGEKRFLESISSDKFKFEIWNRMIIVHYVNTKKYTLTHDLFQQHILPIIEIGKRQTRLHLNRVLVMSHLDTGTTCWGTHLSLNYFPNDCLFYSC